MLVTVAAAGTFAMLDSPLNFVRSTFAASRRFLAKELGAAVAL
jgi:hypothetical protein